METKVTFKDAVEDYLEAKGCPCPENRAYYCEQKDRQYVDGRLSVIDDEWMRSSECDECWYLDENSDLLYDYGYEGEG